MVLWSCDNIIFCHDLVMFPKEFFSDDSQPLPMTNANVIVYAVSRHLPDPVSELTTVVDHSNVCMVLRMVESSARHYFGSGEEQQHAAPNLEYLPSAVRYDHDVLAIVLAQRCLRQRQLFFDGSAASVPFRDPLRAILSKDERLSRKVALDKYPSNDVHVLEFLHLSARDDEEFMRAILCHRNDEGLLRFASERLRDSEDFVVWASFADSTNFQYASDRLRNGRDVARELVEMLPLADAQTIVSSVLSPAVQEDPSIQWCMSMKKRRTYLSVAVSDGWRKLKILLDDFIFAGSVRLLCVLAFGVVAKRFYIHAPSGVPIFAMWSSLGKVLVGIIIVLGLPSCAWMFVSKRVPFRSQAASSNRGDIPPRSRLKKLRREEQRSLLVKYLRENPSEYERVVTNAMRSDRDVARAVSTAPNGSILHFAANSRWRNDKEVVLDIVSRESRASEFEHVSRRLKGDREVVLASVRNVDWVFGHALAPAIDDDEIVLIALDVSMPSKDRRSYFRERCSCCRRSHRYRPSRISDVDPAIAEVKHPWMVKHASTRITNEFNLAMACMRSAGPIYGEAVEMFCNLGTTLKANHTIASYAISADPSALPEAEPNICDDFDLVLKAVTHKAEKNNRVDPLLQYASERLVCGPDIACCLQCENGTRGQGVCVWGGLAAISDQMSARCGADGDADARVLGIEATHPNGWRRGSQKQLVYCEPILLQPVK